MKTEIAKGKHYFLSLRFSFSISLSLCVGTAVRKGKYKQTKEFKSIFQSLFEIPLFD
jgi:hypothetical protein